MRSRVAEIKPSTHVVVAGAFVPFLCALKRAGQMLTVLEIDPKTLKPDELPYFRPADQAATVVPSADVLLIAGATLLNDTLESLLSLCRHDTRVVVVGQTVSLLPDAYLSIYPLGRTFSAACASPRPTHSLAFSRRAGPATPLRPFSRRCSGP